MVGPEAAFSAEQAAVTAATGITTGQGAVVNASSVQVLQSQALAGRAFVLVGFEQVKEGRKEQCLFMYETVRARFGLWVPESGGGGCSPPVEVNGEAQLDKPALEIGGGTSSSGSGPLLESFSHVNGLVYQEDIAEVRVTWEDGQQQSVPVVNGSYLIVRTGEVGFGNVEGLDAEGEVVFGRDLETAPGKTP
jgi:hypothetical protein